MKGIDINYMWPYINNGVLMKLKKKEYVKIKLTIEEAMVIRGEFDRLSGMTDDMKIVELMEELDTLGV